MGGGGDVCGGGDGESKGEMTYFMPRTVSNVKMLFWVPWKKLRLQNIYKKYVKPIWVWKVLSQYKDYVCSSITSYNFLNLILLSVSHLLDSLFCFSTIFVSEDGQTQSTFVYEDETAATIEIIRIFPKMVILSHSPFVPGHYFFTYWNIPFMKNRFLNCAPYDE